MLTSGKMWSNKWGFLTGKNNKVAVFAAHAQKGCTSSKRRVTEVIQ